MAVGHAWLSWTLRQLVQNPRPLLANAQAPFSRAARGKRRGSPPGPPTIAARVTTYRWKTLSDSLPGRIGGIWPFRYVLGRTTGESGIRRLLSSWGVRGTPSGPIYTAASEGNGKTGPEVGQGAQTGNTGAKSLQRRHIRPGMKEGNYITLYTYREQAWLWNKRAARYPTASY